MREGEPTSTAALRDSLGQLSALLKRTSEAHSNYDAVMSRYLRTDRPMRRAWGRHGVLAGVITAAVMIFVVSGSIELFLYAALASALALVIGAVILLVRRAPARRFAVPLFVNAAIIVFLIFGAGRVIGLQLAALLLLAAVAAAPVFAGKIRDAYLPGINHRIAVRNQDAREFAMAAAANDLAPIEQEIEDIQRSYRAGGYRDWYPEKYLDLASVNALWHIVHDRRADSFKEAINVYLQDLHNQYMRNAADQQVAIAQIQFAEQQRATRAVQIGSVMNVGMQAFQGSLTRSTVQAQGAATRAAINAPRTIRFK